MFRLTTVVFRLSYEPLMLYRVVVRVWDPIWLTVFLLWFLSVHKITYIYYAIIYRVKYVACAKLLLVGRCSSAL